MVGVLNATADSLWAGSRFPDPEAAARAAQDMVARGAASLDIGAMSGRPGAREVSPEEERERLLPVLRAVRAAVRCPIWVDTARALVAEAALAAGADVVNPAGGLGDPELAPLVARAGVPLVVVARARLDGGSALEQVVRELEGQVFELGRHGVDRDAVIADPGFGYGKTPEQNLELVRGLLWLRQRLALPVCLGPSRKASIGHLLGGRPVERRLAGTLALVALAAAQGVDCIRVHDVAAASDASRIAAACGLPAHPVPPSPTIVLSGIRLAGVHGVLAEERTRPQPFVLDLELDVDLWPAGASDGLEDTVDYGRVALVASRVLQGPPHQLLESLAAEIAASLLAELPRLRGGVVVLHKPQAPLGLPFGDVQVRYAFGASRLAQS